MVDNRVGEAIGITPLPVAARLDYPRHAQTDLVIIDKVHSRRNPGGCSAVRVKAGFRHSN